MTAEAQGVHKGEGHSVGTRAEIWEGSSCGKMWGGNASANEVLKNFESAALMTGTTKVDFQADGTTVRRRTMLKQESRR